MVPLVRELDPSGHRELCPLAYTAEPVIQCHKGSLEPVTRPVDVYALFVVIDRVMMGPKVPQRSNVDNRNDRPCIDPYRSRATKGLTKK